MSRMRLGELGTFARGKSKHRPRNDERLFSGGGYPLVQTGDVKSASLYVTSHSQEYNEFGLAQSKLWPKGTLAITIAANIAEASILDYPMCFPDSVVGFTADQTKTSELFIYYLLANLRKGIQGGVSRTGSIQDNINLEYLEDLVIDMPGLSVQQKISTTLSVLDNKIELNRKINDKLEQMARTLYDYWFVQFDFPNKQGNPYKSTGGQMVYSDQLKREIPVDWSSLQLKDLLNKRTESAHSDPSLKCIDLSVMPSNSLSIDSFSPGDNFNSNMKSMYKNDILFGSIRPYLKKAGLAPFDGLRAGTVHAFYPKEAEYLEFCLITMTSDRYFDYAINRSGGSTRMPSVSADDLLDYSIPFNEEAYSKYNEALSSFTDIISHNISESQTLAHLRDWLLPMLMNGQVRVKAE